MKSMKYLILISFIITIMTGIILSRNSLSQINGEKIISKGMPENLKYNYTSTEHGSSLIESEKSDYSYESLIKWEDDSVNKPHRYSQKAGSQPDTSNNTKKNVIEYYEHKDWSWSFELFSGYEFYTGELRSSFRDNVPIGMAFDLGFKDLVFDFRGNSGTGKTQKDLYINGMQWNAGENIESGLLEMTFGFKIFESRKIKITPFGGLSLNFILPPEDDIENNPQLKEVGLESTTTYTLGINLDYKLVSTLFPYNSKTKIERNYWYIRLRYGYNMPQFSENYNGFSGNFHYITIGFGAWKRGVKLRK